MDDVRCGLSFPLGAQVAAQGVNFSVYSKNATEVDLLFFDGAEDGEPSRTIPLDPRWNRTFHYWHVCLPGIDPGQLYGYRAHGPVAPQRTSVGLAYENAGYRYARLLAAIVETAFELLHIDEQQILALGRPQQGELGFGHPGQLARGHRLSRRRQHLGNHVVPPAAQDLRAGVTRLVGDLDVLEGIRTGIDHRH